MNVVLRQRMTVAEFLAWEEAQEERWEFDGFAPVAMVGGTVAHNTIAGNVYSELRQRLRGGPCRAFIDGLKVKVDGSIRYPDVFVTCGANPNAATVAENPVVVFEVLSPSTAATDVIVKNREYAATATIQRYVILSQDQVGATVFARGGEGWLATLPRGADAILEMPEIGASVPLRAVYEGVFE